MHASKLRVSATCRTGLFSCLNSIHLFSVTHTCSHVFGHVTGNRHPFFSLYNPNVDSTRHMVLKLILVSADSYCRCGGNHVAVNDANHLLSLLPCRITFQRKMAPHNSPLNSDHRFHAGRSTMRPKGHLAVNGLASSRHNPSECNSSSQRLKARPFFDLYSINTATTATAILLLPFIMSSLYGDYEEQDNMEVSVARRFEFNFAAVPNEAAPKCSEFRSESRFLGRGRLADAALLLLALF